MNESKIPNKSVYAIVPAAGSGSRMGMNQSEPTKVFLTFEDGSAILFRTVKRLVESEVCQGIVVAVREEDQTQVRALLGQFEANLELMFVVGGATRQESVRAGLDALKGKAELVLIHDAARPFCPREAIVNVVAAAQETGAAILAIPVKPTLKQVGDEETISKTIPRKSVWEAQTPQVFRYDWLDEGHRNAAEKHLLATDDSELVEQLGKKVRVVLGSERNIKITSPFDLEVAACILKDEDC